MSPRPPRTKPSLRSVKTAPRAARTTLRAVDAVAALKVARACILADGALPAHNRVVDDLGALERWLSGDRSVVVTR